MAYPALDSLSVGINGGRDAHGGVGVDNHEPPRAILVVFHRVAPVGQAVAHVVAEDAVRDLVVGPVVVADLGHGARNSRDFLTEPL